MKTSRILLGVLFLSGWLISTCLLRQYHFVPYLKTWGEALTYCRTNYTDLATIENTTEMNQLINTVSSAGNTSLLWIGLMYSYNWWWTYYIGSDYLNWENQARNEPLFAYHVCGSISKTGNTYESWSVKHPFICQSGSQLVFVNETMDWFSALRYCRQNFTDLTSAGYSPWSYPWYGTYYDTWYGPWVTDVQNFVPSGYQAWVGIYLYAYSNWADGSSSSFRYLDNISNPFGPVGNMFGVADLQRSGKWRFLYYGTTLPFVCYRRSKLPPVPQVEQKIKKVFKLRLNSSVDLNDPAVKAEILRKLQDRLQETGVTGVTLKWREQPDGKVFHKEEETNVTSDGC